MVDERQIIGKRLRRLEAKHAKNPKAYIRKARIEKTVKRLLTRLYNIGGKHDFM